MPEDGFRGLEAQLKAELPAGFAQLNDEQLRALTEAVRDARHRQAAELEQAAEQALRHIPRLLRGPLRRIVG